MQIILNIKYKIYKYNFYIKYFKKKMFWVFLRIRNYYIKFH